MSVYERLRDVPGPLWCFGAIVLGLNFWIDYYHPLGFVVDGIILVTIGITWFQSRTHPPGNT